MGFFESEKQVDTKSKHTLWCEKYRPTVLADYIGNDLLKEKVQGYLDSNDIPHLLLYGKAGTGKTTLAKIIANTIKCDYMIINASDENGIDILRVKIKNFASGVGFGGYKVIILDEADYLTRDAQAALRNVMETFSAHCRFILTCNYLEKIISPIQSRCQTFQIIPPAKKDVAIQISNILTAENVKFEIKDLVPIIDTSYPDIRKVINTCQLQSSKGELKIDKQSLIQSDVKTKMIELLKGNDDKRNTYLNIRQMILDNKLNDFTELYTHLYEKVDEYAAGNTASVILSIAEAQYKDVLVVDKEICFMAGIIGVIGIIKK